MHSYVEQFDALNQQDTTVEAVSFAAALKLSANLSQQQKDRWVDQIMTMLELDAMKDVLVQHMSLDQKKRLCIGIELAGNPSLLFLDGKPILLRNYALNFYA